MEREANVEVLDFDKSQNIEVLVQEEVQLDINVPLFYIKSGEEDIKAYVTNHAKPELDAHTTSAIDKINQAEANSIADMEIAKNTQVAAVNQAGQIAVENVAGDAIEIVDNHANSVIIPQLQEFTAEAQTQATNAATSASSALASKTSAESYATQAKNYATSAEQQADKITSKITAIDGAVGDIGFAPLGIDEIQNKRRYLNGQVISQAQFVSFTNKVKSAIELYPNLATTETNWQAEVTNSKLGQCGKFVIDDALGTIRLPKVININGLQDLSLLGSIKAESLPNIKGRVFNKSSSAGNNGFADTYVSSFTSEGALYAFNSGNDRIDISNGTGKGAYVDGIGYDASLSSSTYQNNAPVQQEAIQYPYFIQVATGVEESVDVTKEIQLNNPFSLLDYKWSEYELNNASWLLSNGAFHSGATYISVYNLLLEIYNGTVTKDGVSVKMSTEAYEDTDFVINTADTTFRLPVKVKLASGNAVVGNGMTLGLTDGTNNAALRYYYGAADSYLTTNKSEIGNSVGTNKWVNGNILADGTIGITTDPTKSGIETSSSGLKLYFYVGETIQDANVINASGVLTRVAKLSDSYISGLGMPSSKYIDLTLGATDSWYTAPANGWVHLVIDVSAGGYLSIQDNYYQSSNIAGYIGGRVPFQKGQRFYIGYSGYLKTVLFKFFYAEGEN